MLRKHFALEQGPLDSLEVKMLLCGTGIGVAYVAVASTLGALLGAVVRRVTMRAR